MSRQFSRTATALAAPVPSPLSGAQVLSVAPTPGARRFRAVAAAEPRTAVGTPRR